MADRAVQMATVAGEFSPEEAAYFDNRGGEGEGGGDNGGDAGGDGGGDETPPAATAAPKPAPVATAAPAAAAEEVPSADNPWEVDVGGKKVKVAPLEALHEERARRKEANEQVTTMLANMAKLIEAKGGKPEEAAVAQPGEEEIVVPPLDKNPVAHFQAQMAIMARALKRLTEKDQVQTQQTQQQVEQQSVVSKAAAEEVEYVKTTPDYQAAVQHLINARHEQLKELGMEDANARANVLRQEALGIAREAHKRGKTAPEVVYALAKHTGYVPKAPEPALAEGDDDAAAAAVDAALAAEEAASVKAVGRVAAGQRQADTSLGGKGRAPTPMTVERALKLPPDQFSALMETQAGRDLMGA